MSKSTPGPWHVDLASGYANVWRVRDEQDRIIGTFEQLGRIPKGADANAILCAAAPAMLEALQAIEKWVPKTSAAEGGASAYSENVKAADKVRAAISKATKEQ